MTEGKNEKICFASGKRETLSAGVQLLFPHLLFLLNYFTKWHRIPRALSDLRLFTAGSLCVRTLCGLGLQRFPLRRTAEDGCADSLQSSCKTDRLNRLNPIHLKVHAPVLHVHCVKTSIRENVASAVSVEGEIRKQCDPPSSSLSLPGSNTQARHCFSSTFITFLSDVLCKCSPHPRLPLLPDLNRNLFM